MKIVGLNIILVSRWSWVFQVCTQLLKCVTSFCDFSWFPTTVSSGTTHVSFFCFLRWLTCFSAAAAVSLLLMLVFTSSVQLSPSVYLHHITPLVSFHLCLPVFTWDSAAVPHISCLDHNVSGTRLDDSRLSHTNWFLTLFCVSVSAKLDCPPRHFRPFTLSDSDLPWLWVELFCGDFYNNRVQHCKVAVLLRKQTI